MKMLKIILIFISYIIICKASLNEYIITDFKYEDQEKTIFTAELKYASEKFDPHKYTYNFIRPNSTLLVPIANLQVRISLENENIIHFKVTDKDNERWEHPFGVSEKYSPSKSSKSLEDFGVTINAELNKPLTFKFTNKLTNETVFDSEDTDFLYTDNFIGFAFRITSDDVYGFGERMHHFKLGKGQWTMWPNDTNGIHPDVNGYGMQPIALHKSKAGTFMGVLFNNVNDQDVIIKDAGDKVVLEHLTIGGVIDYFLSVNIDDNRPDEVLRLVHSVVGAPPLFPVWSLGYHHSKWGYANDAEMKKVVYDHRAYQIPVDTFWGDLDIMQDRRIWTTDRDKMRHLPELITEMHALGYRFVPLVDIGLAQSEEDPFYRKGKEEGAFILSGYSDQYLTSLVWPGDTVFFDFFTDAGVRLWEHGMKTYYEQIKYDGIWLDMNEPCMLFALPNARAEFLPKGFDFDAQKNPFEYIPYVPGWNESKKDGIKDIRTKTLSENAYSHELNRNKTKYDKFLYAYNFRPLMSLLENKATYKVLQDLGKRPFILSRSTTIGHQRYAAHWLGDNVQDWESFRYGIQGVFSFQVYGLPLVGDDICGFNFKQVTDEMCARWMALGAFYPFSRNHRSLFGRDHEPWVFGVNSRTYRLSRIALNYRYALIRYYYSELFKLSLGESGSFFRPTFFNYVGDSELYERIGESAMISNGFIIYPIYNDSDADINVYLPNDDFTYMDGRIFNTKNDTQDSGKVIKISGSYDVLHLYMKGGVIVPYQNPERTFFANTKVLENQPTEIIVNIDSTNHVASGDVFYDDGSAYTLEEGNYLRVKMDFAYDTLTFSVHHSFINDYVYNKKDIKISKIKFYRADYLIADTAKITMSNGDAIYTKIEKNGETYELNIEKYFKSFGDIINVILYKK